MPKYLSVTGHDRIELDEEVDGGKVGDILASKNVSRDDGEFIIVGSMPVTDDYELQDGETLVYVPPVGLGVYQYENHIEPILNPQLVPHFFLLLNFA